MALTINTNVYSLNAQRNLTMTGSQLANPLQRLSSGLRINSSADDAAGLAISESINSSVRGLNVAIRNSNDAISMTQIADGTAGKITENLQRMRELAVQAANGEYGTKDRANIAVEFKALQAEISRVATNTTFNGRSLANSVASAIKFQIGAYTSADNQISVKFADLRASGTLAVNSAAINIEGGDGHSTIIAAGSVNGRAAQLAAPAVPSTVSSGSVAGVAAQPAVTAHSAIATQAAVSAQSAVAGGADHALAAMAAIDKALQSIGTIRAGFGASINRTQAVVNNLQVAVENQSAARGRIVDADYAAETASLTRLQILQQAGTAILAQANQIPQQALTLLRG